MEKHTQGLMVHVVLVAVTVISRWWFQFVLPWPLLPLHGSVYPNHGPPWGLAQFFLLREDFSGSSGVGRDLRTLSLFYLSEAIAPKRNTIYPWSSNRSLLGKGKRKLRGRCNVGHTGVFFGWPGEVPPIIEVDVVTLSRQPGIPVARD